MLPALSYTPEGFIQMGELLDGSSSYPYLVLISSRGGGKTYGTLKWLIETGQKFIYFRRTKQILDIISDKAYQPFKPLNNDLGWDIQPRTGRGLTSLIDCRRPDQPVIGHMAALSTFSNVRGFDASDITVMVWDEFIPEPSDRITFNMFSAWTHAIETVGRNRELMGKPPVRVIMLSNSDLIYGDVVAGFRIGDELLRMQETGTEVLEHSKDMLLVMPALEDFTASKSDTALYRLTAGSDFADVALHNKFPIEDRSQIGSRPLVEYVPICVVCGVCIYRHKSGRRYYCCRHVSGNPPVYKDNKTDLRRFHKQHMGLLGAYLKKRIDYESIDVQTVIRKIFS